VNHLDPRPRQRDSLADANHLTKKREPVPSMNAKKQATETFERRLPNWYGTGLRCWEGMGGLPPARSERCWKAAAMKTLQPRESKSRLSNNL
jgi:hypothetical protein